MPIRFTCSGCAKMMQAPETAAGKRAKCPLCQTVQVVPPPEPSVPSVSEDDSIFPEVPQGPPMDSAAPSGLPAPPPAFISPPPPPPAPPAQLATDCLKAITYGASNFKSIFILVLYATALNIFLHFLLIFLWPFVLTGLIGLIILGSLGGAAGFIIWGFYFRFFLDAIISSLEGVDQAPDVPEFNLGRNFIMGVKALGVLCVYFFPIVTIPLLPLALLATGYSEDMRAFDVGWALRAAQKRSAQLLILWPILLLWFAAMIVADVILNTLLRQVFALVPGGCIGLLIGLIVFLVGAAVITAVSVMFITVLFRCVGMLGRHNPVLTDMLPESVSPARIAGFIVAGVAASVLVWVFVIPAVLEAVAGAMM